MQGRLKTALVRAVFYIYPLKMVKASTSTIINNTKKMKNKTLAMPEAAAAIPVKPNRPAIIEMIKNINAHLSIIISK